MQNITHKSFLVALAIGALASCKPDLKTPSPDKGSIDVTKYVAIGSSMTAGFADGALHYDAQITSYPNLLAQQFKLIGGGDFLQPLVPMSSVGIGGTNNAKFVLRYQTDCKGVSALAPVAIAPLGDTMLLYTSVANQGPFNNMGVAGVKAPTAVNRGYGDPYNQYGPQYYNKFFARMLGPSHSDYASSSVLSKAVAQNPTFFTLFITDDVLTYALAGAAADGTTTSAGAVEIGFDASIDTIVSRLTAHGAKGAIANIPDITSMPYFTTVPYNGLKLDANQVAQLNTTYASFNISFKVDSNAYIIEDFNEPSGLRKIKSNEFVLLPTPQDSLKCFGLGSTIPIPNKYILTETEISSINSAVIVFNAKLKASADAKGLAFVDVNTFMANCHKGVGIPYNGINVSSTFVSGGLFSLDGVHLTPMGNALLANEFIKSINSKYGSSIPQLNASKYKGVVFP